MKIIINADDFGESQQVNKAIYESAKSGYITSSTIIAVSEYLDEAVEMSQELNNISFGIHLTFTDNFYSISKKPILFNKNDIVKLNRLNFFKLDILINEFSLQIEKLLKKGINISHIDTHHNIHLYPLVIFAIMYVSKKYCIRKIRSQKNLSNNINLPVINKIYRYMHHTLVNTSGLIQPEYYGDFSTFLTADIEENDCGVYEIMCHPGSKYNDEKYFNKDIYSNIYDRMINYHDL